MSDERCPRLCFAVPQFTAALALNAAFSFLQPQSAALALDKIEFPPLREVTLPSYSKHTLPNGLQVYLMEDKEVPLVGGTLTFRGGARSEPAEKTGLASISASVLRSGGSEQMPSEDLDNFLADRAAFLGASADGASFNVSFSCLLEDLDPVLTSFSDLVKHPRFPDDRLALAKRSAFGVIARRNDDPNDIARREVLKLLYGPKSTYARSIDYDTVSAVRREDVLSFYRQLAVPNNATLAVVGSFDNETMLREIEAAFGSDWPAAEILPSTAPEAVDMGRLDSLRGTVFIADKPELSQSYVRAGEIGGLLRDPDYFALDVINQALNGLGGRLFNELRSKGGLAYSVFGEWYPAFDHPGVFLAGGETSSADGKQLVQFIRKLVDTLGSLDGAPLTAEELEYAKDSTLNSFVFNFADAGDILSRAVKYEFYGYPLDFAETYRTRIGEVTAEEVLAASRDRIREDDLIFLVVGNRRKVEPALKAAGYKVQRVDISIPKPPSGGPSP